MDEIVNTANVITVHPKAIAHKTGLIIAEDTTEIEWEEIGQNLRMAEGAVQFWLGDWANFGIEKFQKGAGEKTKALAVEIGMTANTVRQARYVAEKVDVDTRVSTLDYSHFRVIAPMEKEEQIKWRDKAIEGEWSVSKLKKEIKAAVPKPELIEGTFSVIYADPPWKYSNSGFNNSAENEYSAGTMEVEDICNLDIPGISADQTVLFLWATNPLLKEAMQVMDAWGFSYKTNFAWIKDRARGFAWWANSKHELLLVGVRSDPPAPIKSFPSCFEADRGEVHSRKPEYIYDMIESMFPGGNKVELFARQTKNGWNSWGNEV